MYKKTGQLCALEKTCKQPNSSNLQLQAYAPAPDK